MRACVRVVMDVGVEKGLRLGESQTRACGEGHARPSTMCGVDGDDSCVESKRVSVDEEEREREKTPRPAGRLGQWRNSYRVYIAS